MFPARESRFICPEKNCKKDFSGFRQLLNLNGVHPNEPRLVRKEKIRSCGVLKHSRNDEVCPSCLDIWITNALKKSNRSQILPRQLSKITKIYKFGGKKLIRQRNLVVLYLQKADSEVVRDFLSTMNVHQEHLFPLFIDVFKYVLFHANRSGFDLWSPPPGLDFVISSVRYRLFEKTKELLQYLDAPRFCEASYELLKRNINYSRLGLTEDAFRTPVENRLITKERFFLILQIFDVICAESSDGLKCLQLLWRSIPHPFVNLDELTFLFPALKDTRRVGEIHRCLQHIAGEEASASEPRKLKHFCRITIRKRLSNYRRLSTGIGELRLPPSLQSYLKLEN